MEIYLDALWKYDRNTSETNPHYFVQLLFSFALSSPGF